MGYCPKCKIDYDEDAPKFCPECGTRTEEASMAQPGEQVLANEAEERSLEQDVAQIPTAEGIASSSLRNEAAEPAKQGNNLPLILAIVGFVTCWFPFVGLGLGIAAIVLWKKSGSSKMLPVVLGGIVAFLGLILTIAILVTPVDSGTADTSSNEPAKEQVEKKEAKESKDDPTSSIESISASYDGDTSEGTTLDGSNSGIKVTANLKDGSTDDVIGWIVDNPATLKAGETATVTISYYDLTCDLSVSCTSMTPDEFKASCSEPSYDDLLRNPDSWNGKPIKMTGRIQQVVEGKVGEGQYLVNIVNDGYGYYDGTVLVEYLASDEGINLIEDDIVTFYGVGVGTQGYTTVLGANRTVPWAFMTYAELS